MTTVKVIDISREMISAPVYPGDPAPRLQELSRLSLGDGCNLSALSWCLHNGTHLDAPLHFLPDGEDAAEVPLESCVGECLVVACSGVLLGAQVDALLEKQRPERLLFKGDVTISPSAAFVLADAGIRLLGVEAPSVALPEEAGEVHRQLLSSGMVLLEGLDLSQAGTGYYYLFAAPLKIAGADGTPVRAVLLERSL